MDIIYYSLYLNDQDIKKHLGVLKYTYLSLHMYTVGLDVDKLVFTVKILLYAGNSWLSNPLVFITLGKIYLFFTGQSAVNFSFSTKAKAVTKNTYNKYSELPKISFLPTIIILMLKNLVIF